jgi:hypothetical protein
MREILRDHDTGYLRRVVGSELMRAEARQLGFPRTPQMVERSRRSAGATSRPAAPRSIKASA